MKPRRVNVDRMRRYREREESAASAAWEAAWWAMTPAERMAAVFSEAARVIKSAGVRAPS